MGLDSFWRSNDGSSPVIEKDYPVCGGIFSGNGNDSFRGKVYNSLVEDLTGVSLYQEEIPVDVVKDMARKLKETSYNPVIERDYDIGKDEYEGLVNMFVDHAESNHHLVGWW
jgi:hypothetical protein